MISRTKLKAKERTKGELLKAAIILLRKQRKPIWHSVAALLARSRRKAAAVNIRKLNRLTNPNDVVIVPGKVLADGELKHPLTIAALSFSEAARQKLKGAKLLSFEQLTAQNPQGRGIKIII